MREIPPVLSFLISSMTDAIEKRVIVKTFHGLCGSFLVVRPKRTNERLWKEMVRNIIYGRIALIGALRTTRKGQPAEAIFIFSIDALVAIV